MPTTLLTVSPHMFRVRTHHPQIQAVFRSGCSSLTAYTGLSEVQLVVLDGVLQSRSPSQKFDRKHV